MERFVAYLKREGIELAAARDRRAQHAAQNLRGHEQRFSATRGTCASSGMPATRCERVKLAVGRDGAQPNRALAVQVQDRHARSRKRRTWIFSPAVWLRSLIKPEPGMAVAYVDYSSMEFLIAASLSDGHCGPVNNMLDMYESGDPYLSFAKSVGAVPQTATKKSHADSARPLQESCCWRRSMACRRRHWPRGSGISTFDAHEMLEPASPVIRAVLGLVRRLGGARAADWRHADRIRLDVSHWNYRSGQ